MQAINVPYEDRQIAKELGMCFDYGQRKWYYMRDNENIDEILIRWTKTKEVIFLDEVSEPYELAIRLIPRNMFQKSFRNLVSRDDWDLVRRACYIRANYRCEGCNCDAEYSGDRGLEAHEEYTYDDSREECKLTRFVALCKLCHRCVHWGFGLSRGMQSEMEAHMMKIRGITIDELSQEIADAYEEVELNEKKKYPLTIRSVKLLAA